MIQVRERERAAHGVRVVVSCMISGPVVARALKRSRSHVSK